MPRDYSNTYRPNSHTFSTVPPGVRSGYSPESQSVSVVVRNPPANSEGIIPGESQAGIIPDDLYYAPMPLGGEPPGDGTVLMPTPTRGTKRRQETLEDESSRQHRRLTTKEEVALFDICNRNADTFGNRSNLCKWWQSIATEFQRTHHGRSYSWHSVRRKVELVTRQRIKFLEDQRTRTTNVPGSVAEEFMNPHWLAAVDAWIPTWQRWEEAENRRITKRDEIKKRRQPQPWRRDSKTEEPWRNLPAPSATSPDVTMLGTLPTASDEPASPSPSAAMPPAFLDSPSTPASAPTSLKLPPGFENMFSNPVQPPTSDSPVPPNDGRMVSAVLETLGKLNKHLDAASTGIEHSAAAPVISALVQAANETSNQSRGSPRPLQPELHQHPTHMDIERMKEELRQEMQVQFRSELERSRMAMEEKLDSVQQTQEMILEMLRQEPGR